MTKVSIIMPSLNVVQYIEQCLASVISQSLLDIEIICVDAGSEDGTYDVIEKYAHIDSRIKIIKSCKKSYGYQMNIAMKEATGEYIGIVETDDYVSRNMFEELYLIAKKYDLDFVKSDYYQVVDEKTQKTHFEEIDECYNKVLSSDNRVAIMSMWSTNWNGIYKRGFLAANNIIHNETPGASFQDTGFLFQVLSNAQKCMILNESYYYYRCDNPNSSVKSKAKLRTMKEEFDWISSIMLEQGQDDMIGFINYYRASGHWMRFYSVGRENIRDYYDIMKEDCEAICNNVRETRYAYGFHLSWIKRVYSEQEKFLRDYFEILDNYKLLNKAINIYHYGDSNTERYVFDRIVSPNEELRKKLKAIVVTDNTNNIKKKHQTPLKLFAEVDIRDDDVVIVTVNKNGKAYKEITNILKSSKVKNVIDFQYIIDNQVPFINI